MYMNICFTHIWLKVDLAWGIIDDDLIMSTLLAVSGFLHKMSHLGCPGPGELWFSDRLAVCPRYHLTFKDKT